MEYDVKERAIHLLKIVAIVAIFVATIATSIITMMKYEKQKQENKVLISDKADLEIRVEQAEKKIVEQERLIEKYTLTLEVTEEAGNEMLSTEKLLEKQLELLQSGNVETIQGWFGLGSEYTPEKVQDATKHTEFTVIKDKEAPEGYIAVHVCNIDYRRMDNVRQILHDEYIKKNVAMKEEDRTILVDKEINKNIADGKYDKHFKVYVRSINGKLEINEDLKQAFTGGWYWGTGEELKGHRCIYNK